MKNVLLKVDKYLHTEYLIIYATATLAAIQSFLIPVVPFILLCVFLVLSDLYTGTQAARKRGEKIHSRGLRRTIDKFIAYFVAILLAEGMRVVFIPAAPLTYVVAFSICITEFQSACENVETITGVNIWNSIKSTIFRYIKK